MMFGDINKNRFIDTFKIAQNLPVATNKTELSENANVFSSAALRKMQQLKAAIKEVTQINLKKNKKSYLRRHLFGKFLKVMSLNLR